MSRSDGALGSPTPVPGAAGYSLFEVLIALSILAMVIAVSAAGFRPPSDEMKLNRQISDLVSKISDARLKAIRTNQAVGIEIVNCDDEPVNLNLFPDGTASGGEICLEEGTQQETLILSTLTGLLSRAARDE